MPNGQRCSNRDLAPSLAKGVLLSPLCFNVLFFSSSLCFNAFQSKMSSKVKTLVQCWSYMYQNKSVQFCEIVFCWKDLVCVRNAKEDIFSKSLALLMMIMMNNEHHDDCMINYMTVYECNDFHHCCIKNPPMVEHCLFCHQRQYL